MFGISSHSSPLGAGPWCADAITTSTTCPSSYALGLGGRAFVLVRLLEFTEDQAAAYLSTHAATTVLPDWIPLKPLLLGYLAHRIESTDVVYE